MNRYGVHNPLRSEKERATDLDGTPSRREAIGDLLSPDVENVTKLHRGWQMHAPLPGARHAPPENDLVKTAPAVVAGNRDGAAMAFTISLTMARPGPAP
jgi:hypothetical protein